MLRSVVIVEAAIVTQLTQPNQRAPQALEPGKKSAPEQPW
jgi:hypothetical protein